MSQGKITNFFPGGNTVNGFHSFYEYLTYNCQKVYIIKGGPGTGKSTTMKKIGKKAINSGYDIEYHWCSSDNDSIDGVVITDKNTAILDGTAPHTMDPKYPGVIEDIINVGRCWNNQQLNKNKKQIINLFQKISEKFEQTYRYLSVAQKFQNEWEKIYLKHFNHNLVNKITDNIIKEILPEVTNITISGQERRLFGSAITPGGLVDFINELTHDISKRYILNGKPEIKKSKILEKIGNTALKYGFNVLYLHCSFNPKHIDGVIIKELDTAIINETKPHLINSCKEDKFINILKGVDSNIINQNASQIKEIKKDFNHYLNKAVNSLNRAKILHDELEEFYIKAMNFSKLDQIKENLVENIFSTH
ncbi:MAG: hypothetical protein ACOC1O_03470 [bacterium]